VHDEANVASSGVPRKLGFTEIARRPHPDGPETPAESGTDVVWRLTR
jgi:ribosomal-protein-serine acetyltransferase